MSPDSLVEVCGSRLQDFAEQYRYLVSIGCLAEAEVIAQEGRMIAQAHDNNDVFMVLEDFTNLH